MPCRLVCSLKRVSLRAPAVDLVWVGHKWNRNRIVSCVTIDSFDARRQQQLTANFLRPKKYANFYANQLCCHLRQFVVRDFDHNSFLIALSNSTGVKRNVTEKKKIFANDRKKLEMISQEKNSPASDARGTKCKFVFFFRFCHHKIAFWVRFLLHLFFEIFFVFFIILLVRRCLNTSVVESGDKWTNERVFRVKDDGGRNCHGQVGGEEGGMTSFER